MTDPEKLVGTVVANRYNVIGILGAGGQGAVCEVTDVSTGRPAALKLLVGDDPDLAARLVREGKALSMLAHPHIVELVDTGSLDDGTPYVVTELIRGTSLQKLIDTTVVDPTRALSIVRQLLEALHHAHGAGLIHRDIKPDNILVEGEQSFVKLLDFGVAKVLDPNVIDEAKLTRAGLEVFGTPAYMSPETVIGEPVDARSDLYSVGVVLFELLVGRLPFHHDDHVALMRKHVTDIPPRLGEVAPDRVFAPELQQLVAQALAKEPAARFVSAMAMHAAVLDVARSLDAPPKLPMPIAPTPPSVPSFWDRTRRFVRETVAAASRHPGRTAAIGSATLVLVIVIIVIGSGSPPAPAPEPVSPVVVPAPIATPTRSAVTQADGELAKKHYGSALTTYERALVTDRALGRDDKLRTAVAKIASNAEPVTAIVALEILATRLDPPDTKTIIELASTSRTATVRRRAFAIAERDDFARSIDRFASWTLDLQQGSCDDRREAITKLRDLGDKRAVDPLQKARALPCIAKDAAAAIAQLQAPP